MKRIKKSTLNITFDVHLAHDVFMTNMLMNQFPLLFIVPQILKTAKNVSFQSFQQKNPTHLLCCFHITT